MKNQNMKINKPDVRLAKGASQPAINFSYSNMKERSNSSSSLASGLATSHVRRPVDTKPHQSLSPLQFKPIQPQQQVRQQGLSLHQLGTRTYQTSPNPQRSPQDFAQPFQQIAPVQSNNPIQQKPLPQAPAPVQLQDFIMSPQNSLANLSTAVTNPFNMLRQERVITIDESDFKLELEVMKIKYKTLEEKYDKLEADMANQNIVNQQMAKREAYHNNTVIQEDQAPSSSDRLDDKGKMSEIISLRVDQELDRFKAQAHQRELQIKAKYDEYFVHLRGQNQHMGHLLREKDERIATLHQKMGSAADIQKLEWMIKEREQQIISLKSKLGEYQKKASDFQKNFGIMEAEIQRCNSQIIKKNTEILNLKNAPSCLINQQIENDNQQLKLVRLEFEKIKQICSKKQKENNELREQSTQIESNCTRHLSQNDNLKQQLAGFREKLNHAEFQLSKARQTLEIKEHQVAELLQDKQKLRNRVQTVSEQQVKDRQDYRNRINQLEHRIIEIQKRSKTAQGSLKDNLKKVSESNRTLASLSDERFSKMRLVEEEISQAQNMLQKERFQRQRELRACEQKLMISEKYRVQIEGLFNQATLELERKKQEENARPDSETVENKLKAQIKELTEEVSKLRIELEKKNTEIDGKRVQFQGSLRKFRQQCQDSYRDTLRVYEQKIEELENKRHRKKDIGQHSAHKDHRSPRISSQSRRQRDYEEDHVDQSFFELQDRITDFLERINHLIDNKQIKPNGNTDSLKVLVGDLNNKMREFKRENSKLRHKIHKKKKTQGKLKEYQQQNKRLMEGYGQHGQKVEMLVAEVNRLRALAQEYQVAIYHGQVGRQFAPKGTQGQLEERIKMLEEKAQFYKEKNTDMEGRINNLINLNSSLKIQLQDATKTSVNGNIQFMTQQMAKSEQNTLKLQEQVRKANDEAAHIRSENHNKILTIERENQIKYAESESKIVQLSLKVSGMKSEKTICQNDLKLAKETLSHRQALVQQLSIKLQSARREIAELTSESRRRQDLEAALRQSNTKLGSLTMQRNHLQADNTSMKKHCSYLEKQLLVSNQKLSAGSTSHLGLQLQLTQTKATLSHSEKRLEDLQQQIRALQRYRSDCDSTSNEDRLRISHLEIKLRELYYELEKLGKAKQTAELELNVLRNHYAQQKEQLVKFSQQKKEAELQLNRLRIPSNSNSNTRPPSSSSNNDLQLKSYIVHLESNLNQLKTQLIQSEAERSVLAAALQHVKDVVQPSFTSKIRELEEIIQHVSVSAQAQEHAESLNAHVNSSAANTRNNEQHDQLVALTQQFKKIYHRSIEMQQQLHQARESQMAVRNQFVQIQAQRTLRINQLQEQVVKVNHNIHSLEKLLQQKDMLLNVSTKEFQDKFLRLEMRYKSIESMTEASGLRSTNQINFMVQQMQEKLKAYEHIAMTSGFSRFFIEKIRNNCVELQTLLHQYEFRQKQQVISQAIYSNIEQVIVAADETSKIASAIEELRCSIDYVQNGSAKEHYSHEDT